MSGYTAEMAHEAVARGAAWLDERCPDWAGEIDVQKLNLQDTNRCVLGQTATCILGPRSASRDPGYWRVRRGLGLDDDAWAEQQGFDVPEADGVDEYSADGATEYGARYEMLTIAWKELIRQRLEADS